MQPRASSLNFYILQVTSYLKKSKMSVSNNSTFANGTDPPLQQFVEQYEETTGLRVFRFALFSLIILASLIGNSMVCYAVWSIPSRKPLSYYLVANTAIAEILNSVCLSVIFVNRQNRGLVVRAKCILNPPQVLAILVVTYSLAVIALYRYRVMVEPNPRGPSAKIKLLTILGVWLVSIAISLPLFIGLRYQDGECKELPVASNDIYILTRFILNYALPYVIMLASYGAVAWNLRKRIAEKTIEARNSMVPSSCVVEAEDQIELQDAQVDEVRRFRETEQRKSVVNETGSRRGSKPDSSDLEKDLLKMIFVIIIIFVVCYFPYQAHFLWARIYNINAYQFRYHSLMRKYIFILICLPGALHPLCYGTMSRFYAKAFSRIILCRK